eukprot:gene577-1108_t
MRHSCSGSFSFYRSTMSVSLLVLSYSTRTSSFTQIKDNFKNIFSDMDGTLLRNSHTLSPRTRDAIKNAVDLGINFFPATGRSRPSLARCFDESFLSLFGGPNNLPGVYQQGLMVYDRSGKLIFERLVDPTVVDAVEIFCASLSEKPGLVAYNEDRVFCRHMSVHTECLLNYRDSVPEAFPEGLYKLRKSGMSMHKLIIMHDPPVLQQMRPLLEVCLGDSATITQAVPNMLEVLPYGASKGDGVMKLLQHYSLSSDQTLVFGDGENDIEMFEAVHTGAAVQNANEKLKQVADLIIPSNEEDGVAQVLEHILRLRQSSSRLMTQGANAM